MESNLHYDWALWYYWYTVLLGFGSMFKALIVVSAGGITGLMFFRMISFMDNEEINTKMWNKYFAVTISVFVIASSLLAFIPSKEDMRNIVALIGVETAVKSDKAQNIAGKSVKVLEKYLDKLSKDD